MVCPGTVPNIFIHAVIYVLNWVFVPAHPGGVSSLRVVLQDSGQAKVWHFTHQIAVDQDVSSCQVSVNVAHVWQILHARGDATQHANQLDACKLGIMFLKERRKEGKSRRTLLMLHS